MVIPERIASIDPGSVQMASSRSGILQRGSSRKFEIHDPVVWCNSSGKDPQDQSVMCVSGFKEETHSGSPGKVEAVV